MASLWLIVATTTKTALETSKGSTGGGVLAHGSISSVMPFIFAMLLTNDGLQSTVQVESTVNGKVTAIDNVPFIIAILPSAASTLSQEVGSAVETAFQGSGTDYPSISASGNGFINPLKILLTSRTAIMRIGGIESQVKSVTSACLGTDSGINYGEVNALILNAGNTGANSAKSFEVADISGTAPTGIGALLFQASLNTTGYVPDLTSDGTILSCSDAAELVAEKINVTLNGPEFGRVVQGAATGMDEPNPTADTSISAIFRQYSALRNANATSSALALGSNQAGAELINLLFYELVTDSLNCLKADSTNRVACEAGASQVNEMERNNIQAAASTLPMLKYAGNFANYMLALMIGLGPVIVMFMMFAGVDSGKYMKTAAHVMIWPLLVMNVGAELVNGMIYHIVANFFTSLTQGGYLSPALAIDAYKEFGLQVGTASQIMASLPIIMSMIFVLGASSALVGVANKLTPHSNDTSKLAAPEVISPASIVRQGNMATVSQGVGFANVKNTGALDAVATSATYGSLTKEASATNTSARIQQKSITEGKQNVADWKESFAKGDYTRFGIDNRTGESIRRNYEENQREAERQSTGRTVDSTKGNTNSTQLAATASASAGIKGFLPSASATVGASATTSTGSQDTLTAGTKTEKGRSVDESKSLSKAISAEVGKTTTRSTGNDKTHSLQKSVDTQNTYQKTVGETESNTDATSTANKANENFVQNAARIGAPEIAQQMNSNGEYATQQIVEGRAFDALPSLQEHRATAQKDMENGATDQMVGNKDARDAVVRHRAAVMLAQDKTATPEDRFKAGEFLEHSAGAMQHMHFQAGDTSMRRNDIEAPTDRTGVNAVDLTRRANPPSSPAPSTQTHKKPGNSAPHESTGSAIPPVPQVIPDSIGASVKAEVETARRLANDANLGEYGDGTVVRAGKNVANNVASIAKPAGTPSNVSLGDLSKAAQKLDKGGSENQIPK